MIFKRYEWSIIGKVFLLFITLCAASFLLVKGLLVYEIVVIPLIIPQLYYLLASYKKIQQEVDRFAEAIHYKDFSLYFNVKNAPPELQSLRKSFNDINSTFKLISKEKETHSQYQQKILELVDTGILSYETETGEVIWMNDSLKKLLQVPYMHTIYSLSKRDPVLYKEVITLQEGSNKIATAKQENNSYKILIAATSFQTDAKKFKLVAFQNINVALDETESKAWQKLLSVMTHEIMNSVAPISSVADTLKTRLQNSNPDQRDKSSLREDLEIGIDTIKRRSDGLLKFAQVYRNLNKIAPPNLTTVYIRDLFENIHRLMFPTLDQKGIELEVLLNEPGLTIEVDINLIEQVLINLVINAVDAVKTIKQPKITLAAYTSPASGNRPVIKVADNGSGIPEDILDKIFVPFFSTKKNGSGIGLSLCKQIMMLHKGNIQAISSGMGNGTLFTLQFP
jgi:nitrogen fixation/metabolism regulation signal transduction histidine kinase